MTHTIFISNSSYQKHARFVICFQIQFQTSFQSQLFRKQKINLTKKDDIYNLPIFITKTANFSLNDWYRRSKRARSMLCGLNRFIYRSVYLRLVCYRMLAWFNLILTREGPFTCGESIPSFRMFTFSELLRLGN